MKRENLLILIIFGLLLSCMNMHTEGAKEVTKAKTVTDYTDNYQDDRRICKPERKSFGFPINY